MEFFDRKVERIPKSKIRLAFAIATMATLIVIFQITFIGILNGDHRYTWALLHVNPSNAVLWSLSGIILALDASFLVFMFWRLIKLYKNPFLYKSNAYVLASVALMILAHLLIPNLIPINYFFPIISIIVGSLAIFLL